MNQAAVMGKPSGFRNRGIDKGLSLCLLHTNLNIEWKGQNEPPRRAMEMVHRPFTLECLMKRS